MSFSLFARPAPTDAPEPVYLGQLKHKMARRYWGHDGSLRTGCVRISRDDLSYLEGVRDGATGDTKEDADKLISMIRENPQGVDIWIGDHND